jgi:DNA modification methylase
MVARMTVRLLIGDCREKLRELPDASVHCCVTSPPYFGLRDYGVEGQMGLEPTPDEFVAGMVDVFREVRRVLRDDGTLWLNIGDSYTSTAQGTFNAPERIAGAGGREGDRGKARGNYRPFTGCKPKDLVGIPWMLAFALRADGWYLRQDIIWSKPNPMPESVRDRCTKAHEYLFLLSKGPRYYFDAEAIAEPVAKGFACSEFNTGKTAEHQLGRASAKPRKTWEERKAAGEPMRHGLTGAASHGAGGWGDSETRNKRSVWEVATQPFSEAHFATYPPALIEPCILAGCPKGGTVLDPFGGAGTTGLVADRLQRDAILIELNPEYAAIAQKRLRNDGGMFSEVLAA